MSYLTANGKILRFKTGATLLRTPYVSQYQTIYNTFSTKPDSLNAAAQNNMVASLVSNNLWNRMDVFYVFANNTSDNALINWKSPGTYNCTKESSSGGQVEFSPYFGYRGDGSSYLDTHFFPTPNGVNVAENSTTMGVYVKSHQMENSAIMGASGALGGRTLRYDIYTTTGYVYANINCGTNTQYEHDGARVIGLHMATRRGATDTQIYHNGTSLSLETDSMSGLTTRSMYILALNDNSTASSYSTGQVSLAFMMNGISDSDASTLNTIIQTYMSAIDTVPSILRDGSTWGWYQYDVSITKGSTDSSVSLWSDRLGTGHNLAQSTILNQPKWKYDSISFTATQPHVLRYISPLSQPEMIYLVLKQDTWAPAATILDGSSLGSARLRQTDNSPGISLNVGNQIGPTYNLPINTWGIARMLLSGSSSFLQINNNDVSTGTLAGTAMNGLTLGIRGDLVANAASVSVKELIIRNTLDTSANQTLIYNYLKNKYTL